ncbi:multiple sugar transport system permease protein/N,N'-diacetylchitobiose transport system permease protein [Rhizobium azibense]|uniref:Multiple sugar transport system permease protein/N,N'-diacetylchitobiose transport system permease protein n=1 Tax=Rhizobium azibense TaxID=1136135 RepID=A0A4R3RXS4_9HYPH|nr:carbohydrate ABC transporter permease [Rhizobium azibense]TCU30801.1 multiple sugar transport system permease protein/N,N'-diacetylchitobiose transport system permease protein [Rhizobium azibense]TCU41180.1 multiple sugar transport system permease protein/N,N'-diacetylchitobiose transport system permease protein [Rhizobium azibense]
MSSALSNRTGGQIPAVLGSFIIGIIVLGPILWAFATSFKTEVEAVVVPPTIWPNSPTLENYTKVLQDAAFLTDLWNSVAYSVGAVIIALLVGIPAGYAAARFSFKGKRALMLTVLATSMVPGVALLVPTYYLLETVGLLNSGVVVTIILSARIIPQTVWFIANFVEAVPIEIEDSAMIDGASRFQIIWSLILPLIRPGIAAVATIGIVTTWNDYITVAVFAPEVAKRTLQVALVNQVFDAVGISWSYMMAFVMVASSPVIFMFGFVQKWFISGLTAGAVKG